jgi:F420-dependent oxidoreductase-like protein
LGTVKFGVMLPVFVPSYPPPRSAYHALQYDFQRLDFAVTRKVTLEAERLGYDSLWVSDHLSRDIVKDRFECWTTLCTLIPLTERIRLGTMVLCNLYRHPGILAKMAATADVLSGGRLEFGIGACWSEGEFKEYGIAYPVAKIRLEMLREAVEIIKSLWTKETTSYRGKHYHIEEAYCSPKPLQKPHPPVLIGGSGEQITLRIVAKHADKSNFGPPIELTSRKISILKSYCSRIGRDYDSIEKTCSLSVIIHSTTQEYLDDMKRRYTQEGSPGPFEEWLKKAESTYVGGTPEQCLRKIEEYVRLGISHFVIRFGDVPKTDGMELFARKVAKKIS